ncbi:hypothetical protein [Methylorubrum extorquens]|uniref:hypothetical protein n=1 Tax=Methylorubrum extorquens TaxID=408 RepID=UPI0012DB6355|nr:hypothetical protein [Methylorubrum extorquens]
MSMKSKDAYTVIFASNAELNASPGTILVVPSSDRWNDFGFEIRVDLIIHPREGHSLTGEKAMLPCFFGFLEVKGRSSEPRSLRQLLEEQAKISLSGDHNENYFTMLPDMATYRDIVTSIGPSEARLVLSSLRDVVEADDRPSSHSWLRAAVDTRVFRRAFLRTTESFFAWKNAGSILEGVQFEQVGRISEEIRICFKLAGRPNEHQLNFRFAVEDPVLPKRFAVVIGKNGVGKTQTLGRIADAAVRGLNDLTDGNGDRALT